MIDFPLRNIKQTVDNHVIDSEKNWHRKVWDIHGVRVEWVLDDPALMHYVEEMLHYFEGASATGDISPDIQICVDTQAQWSMPPDADVLPPSKNEAVDTLSSYDLETVFGRSVTLNYYGILPMGAAAYDLDQGFAIGYLEDFASYTQWKVTHLYLFVLLIELLRGQGLYWVHAGCVTLDHRAVLLIGQSGAGKTTTSVNLTKHGFKFVSEDRVFLRSHSNGVEVLGFPIEIALTKKTTELLTFTQAFVDEDHVWKGKVKLKPDMVFGKDIMQLSGRPEVILFTEVGELSDSEFIRLPRAEALKRMLTNSLLVSQPNVSRKHFDVLSKLVQQSRCYSLKLGRDIETMPQSIAALLEQATSE